MNQKNQYVRRSKKSWSMVMDILLLLGALCKYQPAKVSNSKHNVDTLLLIFLLDRIALNCSLRQTVRQFCFYSISNSLLSFDHCKKFLFCRLVIDSHFLLCVILMCRSFAKRSNNLWKNKSARLTPRYDIQRLDSDEVKNKT